jgi:Fe-S cluster assembly protein SufD
MRPAALTPAELFDTLTLDERGRAIADRFAALGLPGNKTEQYRHFAVKPLLAQPYALSGTEQPAPPVQGNTLEITNGIVTALPQQVGVTFDAAFAPEPEHFDALYFLSHLLVPHTILLSVKEDAVLNITHRLTKAQTLLSCRIVLKTAPGTKVSVYETFASGESAGSLLLYGVDVKVGEKASLTWIRNQSSDEGGAAVIGTHRYDVGAGAAFRLRTFDFGSGTVLHLYRNDLAERADAQLDHLLFASGRARLGNVVRLRHNGENGTCLHRAKSILKESATGIFDGLIRVDKAARYTSARQHSQAILLNDGAFMYAKPQLEIYTDELQASHGATTGQLDEATLFYLRSRGIPADESRKMLILAFADEMIEAVEDERLAEKIRADFEAAYHERRYDDNV